MSFAFKPDWAVHPAEILRETLNTKNITVVDFAIRMGMSLTTARSLIRGRASITPAIAERLESSIGGTRQFWINGQRIFDERSQASAAGQ